MKKDKKFLLNLEKELTGISKKQKNIIVLKYKNLINKELKNKKNITKILNNLGNPKEIAKREINELNDKKFFRKILNKIKTKKTNKNLKDKKDKKTKKIKIEVIREYDIKDSPKIKNQIIDSKEVIEIEKEIKPKKNKKINKKRNKINILSNISKINILKKINFNKLNFFKNHNKVVVNKKRKSNIKQNVKSNVNDNVSINTNSVSIYQDLTTQQLVLRILGTILIAFMFIINCISFVLFMSSLIAYLDGVKIIGIPITLFGISLLILILTIILSKEVYKKNNIFKINIILIILCVIIISLGITFSLFSIKNLIEVKDVSEKYNFTTKSELITFPRNNSPVYIIFNSEYDLQYEIKFDDNLDGKFRIETKYYEEYYDYYIKKSTNDVYVSLSTDFRDRLSVYIDDIKENKIFDNNELKRYVVRISVNEKDYSRIKVLD